MASAAVMHPRVEVGSREFPLLFTSEEKAQNYSEKHQRMIWAAVAGWAGQFKIYPGGRRVWYKEIPYRHWRKPDPEQDIHV